MHLTTLNNKKVNTRYGPRDEHYLALLSVADSKLLGSLQPNLTKVQLILNINSIHFEITTNFKKTLCQVSATVQQALNIREAPNE